MGLAVGPRRRPQHLVVGDAGGSINPFNGEGIAYGYETGRLAAAVARRGPGRRGRRGAAAYERRARGAYGLYYRVGRAFVRLISRPRAGCACASRTGMRVASLME